MELINKLAEIQHELKAPKNQFNSFGKYKYRSAEDILEAAKPLCNTRGIVLFINDSIEQVGDRIYIKATASVTDGENTFGVSAYAREAEEKKGMDSSQVTGAASSYARKYALNGLFCIDDTKDADSATNQVHEIRKLMKATDTDEQQFLQWIGSDSVENIQDFNKAINALKAKERKQ